MRHQNAEYEISCLMLMATMIIGDKCHGALLALLFIFMAGMGNVLLAQNETYLVVNLVDGRYDFRNQKPDLSNDACRTSELWLRRIPKGNFSMGSLEDGNDLDGNFPETPHDVTITADYYIGIFECTQKQWELVMGDTPSVFRGDTRPVENIPYDMIRGNDWPSHGHNVSADSFMHRLNQKTNLLFDLPTEAEWEYACRAGSPSGASARPGITEKASNGRHAGNRGDLHGGYLQHTVVGQYAPNAWGLYDMLGNVREWCLDWFDAYRESDKENPTGPDTGSSRLVRGGNWMDDAKACRSTLRKICRPNSAHGGLGFRIVCHSLQERLLISGADGVSTAMGIPSDYLIIDLKTGNWGHSSNAPDLKDDTCRTTKLWMKRILKGSFQMGSPEGEEGRDDEDETRHEVELSQDYYIGVFECTQAQWDLVMGKRLNPSKYKGATRPVECVSYNAIRGSSPQEGGGWPFYKHAVDADSFLGKLRNLTGLMDLDLPTEAQWEYACRADDTRDTSMDASGRFFGNKNDGNGGYAEHTVIGQYLPNTWGLYDMRGNVAEWCLDWHVEYDAKKETDPQGPPSGQKRILRGGSWLMDTDACRSASRNCSKPSSLSVEYGFRIVCPVPNKP